MVPDFVDAVIFFYKFLYMYCICFFSEWNFTGTGHPFLLGIFICLICVWSSSITV